MPRLVTETCLLAPVPRTHIEAARAKAAQTGGRVAFGTGDFEAGNAGAMWEFFTTKVHQGMKVLIYVSSTGTGEHHGYVFSHEGVFERIVASEAEVAHLRPDSTQTDTGHGCYWVVSGFRQLAAADHVAFADLKVSPPLRGPVVKAIMH